MATSSDRVRDSSDDAANIWGDNSYDYTQGTYKIAGTIGKGESSAITGIRFRTVNVPQGATINSAELRLYTDTVGVFGKDLKVRGVDADDTSTWADTTNEPIDATTVTTAQATKTVTTESGEFVDVDVTSIIQELVDRVGWSANNNISFRLEDDASGNVGDWTITTYDGSAIVDGQPIVSPRLEIDYTVASATNMQINIGDDWKSVDAMQINIGDDWKAVEGVQINIGDVWKTVY